MNEVTTVPIERSINDLKPGEQATSVDGHVILKLENGTAVYLETGRYVPNQCCLVHEPGVCSNILVRSQFGKTADCVFYMTSYGLVNMGTGYFARSDLMVEPIKSFTVRRKC